MAAIEYQQEIMCHGHFSYTTTNGKPLNHDGLRSEPPKPNRHTRRKIAKLQRIIATAEAEIARLERE